MLRLAFLKVTPIEVGQEDQCFYVAATAGQGKQLLPEGVDICVQNPFLNQDICGRVLGKRNKIKSDGGGMRRLVLREATRS